jgi:hypothetical protein
MAGLGPSRRQRWIARSFFTAAAQSAPDSLGPSRRRPDFAPVASPGLPDRSTEWTLPREGLALSAPARPRPPRARWSLRLRWCVAQRQLPGELLHFDIKKLGKIVRPSHRVAGDRRDQVRGAGWEFVHVCIDDASRLAFAQTMPDEGQKSAVLFLERCASFGTKAQRIMSDHGSCYRSHQFRAATSAPSPPPHFYSPLHPLAPMATPNASSRLPYANGPTPPSTPTPSTAPLISNPGSTAITGIARTPPSSTNRPPPNSIYL